GYVRRASLLKSSQSSSFVGTISSMRSDRALRVGWKTCSRHKTSLLKVQRWNLPNSSQQTKKLRDWGLRTSTTRTQSSIKLGGRLTQTQRSLGTILFSSPKQPGTTHTQIPRWSLSVSKKHLSGGR